ncbi:GNAT family N-acetyltransferase [Lactococcus lactis]|uniref:Probable acetyltransferase n=1 Tax=Lactococcus lactis subsp. lactis A12 TaxID=1137134 RepID=S6FRZ8_LACLL|nr:GNAT family N-acetyltransferase [Lactococcus lactis]USI47168.1 GNAT family N-acetyltransferase [Lactococcus lactis]CDG03877.1 Probable acetyltransferase [Lactococcus lactis subsp. lactis A12]SBW30929.1 Probable acetyltransferase [Lactococcus lactis subsp. lactis]
MKITKACQADFEQIINIENTCFPPNEAASPEAMRKRIEIISDTFLVAFDNGKVLGYIVGPVTNSRYIDDELFEKVIPNRTGLPTQTILSLAVAPKAQGKGVATALLNELAKVSRVQGREIISLTCLERLKPYYKAHGYVDEGIAESVHGGEVWYNMTFNLNN